MFFGTCEETGMLCAYELPKTFTAKTAAEFEAMIIGYNHNPKQREELQGQPIIKGLAGPMFNGYAMRKSTGETVAIIRYENY